ncbi:MAG: ATP-binding cassette domain-containing protein [Cytophagaceae bacterium]|nr:ATP-binding cassette domain-containing protein [Cytophagaceae bacterium]
MLKANSITKYYKGNAVLSGVSFAVGNGDVLGIVGPNGAGKSTLLRIVSGIIDADEGEVLLEGNKLTISAANSWGYLPEERGLYPQMRVLDQLIHFAGLKGMTAADAKKKAIHLLQQLKMEQYSASKAGDLSKGNQQRIQFLTAILHDPALIILDEPFSGLDPIQTDWLNEQIQLFKKQGKKIIYSSHRMESVEALCDRILVLHNGERKAYGTAAELCRQPAGMWQINTTGGNTSWHSLVQIVSVELKDNGHYRTRFSLGNTALPSVVLAVEKSGANLESIKKYKRSLHEVFVQLTKDDAHAE